MSINAIPVNEQLIKKDLSAIQAQVTQTQDETIFEASTAQKKGTSENEFSCTDSNDDGKLSFKEKFLTFNKGVIDKAKEQISDIYKKVKEHPIETVCASAATVAGTAAVGALVAGALTIPFVAGFGLAGCALGVVTGGYQLARGIGSVAKNYDEYKNAQTDDKAKSALHSMGGSTTEAVEGGAVLASSLFGLKQVGKSIKIHKDAVSSTSEYLATMNDGYGKQAQRNASQQSYYNLYGHYDNGPDFLETMDANYYTPWAKYSSEENATFYANFKNLGAEGINKIAKNGNYPNLDLALDDIVNSGIPLKGEALATMREAIPYTVIGDCVIANKFRDLLIDDVQN